MSALAQHLQNLQNQLIVLETQNFQNLKIQENQEKLIKDLKISTTSTNQTSFDNQPEMLNLIRKLALISKQYEKLVVKNIMENDNYSLVETLKNQELLYKHFKTKNRVCGISRPRFLLCYISCLCKYVYCK